MIPPTALIQSAPPGADGNARKAGKTPLAEIKKILLVDDVPLFLELEKGFLEGFGASVYTATDGAEAVRIAKREKPDLIIMDLIMPGMDGDEACQTIKTDPVLASTPVILVTAQTADQATERARGCKADALAFKPLKRQELLDQIDKLLSARHHEVLAGKKQVLVIGDSMFFLQLIQDVLHEKGHVVHIASDQAQVQQAIAAHNPDLVLIDLLLTKSDPIAVLEGIRDSAPGLRAAALTSLAPGDPLAVKAKEMGLVDYISKNIPASDIGYRIDEILFANAANTRRAPRYSFRAPIQYKKGRFWILGEIANISASGMCVKALELPENGAQILLRFQFPYDKENLEEEAQVVWINAPGRPAYDAGRPVDSGFGVHFSSPSGTFKERLGDYVKRQGRT